MVGRLVSRVRFLRSEEGATVVSWITLTVSALSILLSALSLVFGGVETLAQDTRTALANSRLAEAAQDAPSDETAPDATLQ
jgi:hypothetical protein